LIPLGVRGLSPTCRRIHTELAGTRHDPLPIELVEQRQITHARVLLSQAGNRVAQRLGDAHSPDRHENAASREPLPPPLGVILDAAHEPATTRAALITLPRQRPAMALAARPQLARVGELGSFLLGRHSASRHGRSSPGTNPGRGPMYNRLPRSRLR
jgi:hypothetical protein